MPTPARLRSWLKQYLFEGDMLRLMALTLLIKPVGLLTQMLTARNFGAGAQYDAYALTFFLVTFLDNLVGQSYNTVVLPLTIRMRERWPQVVVARFQNLAAAVFLIPVVVYMAILTLRGGWILGLLAPELPDETRLWVYRLIPVMALPGMALMVVTMVKSVLNANRRFGVAGAMPLVGGVIILAALVVGAGPLGIWCLPLGFLVSAVVQMVVTLVFAARTGCVVSVRPAAPPGELQRLWDLGGVFLLSQAALLCGLAADRYFATGLEVGSVSALAYTASIVNMGTQLFSLSVTVVMFTRMAEMIAVGDMGRCGEYVRDNLSRQMRIVVPGSLALSLAAPEIVRVLFQHGVFDAVDAARTAGVMSIYVLALPGMVANTLVARVFHVLQRIRDRIWLHVVYVLVLIGCNLALAESLRVRGIAISATIGINLLLALSLGVLVSYRTGLRVRLLAGVMGRAYVYGGIVYVVYRLSGLAGALASWGIRSSLHGAVLIGLIKAGFVFTLYLALLLLVPGRDGPRPGQPAAEAGSG